MNDEDLVGGRALVVKRDNKFPVTAEIGVWISFRYKAERWLLVA